jgi:hypothetical protein
LLFWCGIKVIATHDGGLYRWATLRQNNS